METRISIKKSKLTIFNPLYSQGETHVYRIILQF